MLLLLQAIRTALTVLFLQGTLHILQQTGTTVYLQHQAMGAAQHLNIALAVYTASTDPQSVPFSFARPSSSFAPPVEFEIPHVEELEPIYDSSPSESAAVESEIPHEVPDSSPPESAEDASLDLAGLAEALVSRFGDQLHEVLLIQRELLARGISAHPVVSTFEPDPSPDVPPSETVQEEGTGQPTAGSDQLPPRPGYDLPFLAFVAVVSAVLTIASQPLFLHFQQWYRGAPDAAEAPPAAPPPRLCLELERETNGVLDVAMHQADTRNCVDSNTQITIRMAPSTVSDDRGPVAESSAAALRRQAAEAGPSSGGRGNVDVQAVAFAALQALLDGWSALTQLERSGALCVLLERAHPCVQTAFQDGAAGLAVITLIDPVKAEAAMLAYQQLLELWPGLSSADQTVHLTALLLRGPGGEPSAPLEIELIVEEEVTDDQILPAPCGLDVGATQRENTEDDEEEDKENRPPRVDKGKGRQYEIEGMN
ncbi:hypothetical protein FB45DRAFT_1052760 [Roridomyces roridus]|uniref:Uncharacterized protein n=1 Tax=Roridomyces roridus TaxID=1738132 RepID=A0AAD7CAP9_9AGAR|nr:hypothetical protein FB45DRAFT_1052760 [Roridomyces roridus]